MRTISSRQNPIVRTFREVAAESPSDGSRLLLDGVHLVEEARRAGIRLDQVAVSAERATNGSELARLADALVRDGVDVLSVTSPVMNAISPVRTPSGIVALASRTPVSLRDICSQRSAFVLAILDVQDPGNLGALLRAAEAGGVTGAVVAGGSASPFSWKAVRGSMGSVLRLPVSTAQTASQLLGCSRKFGLRSVASVARGGDDPGAVDWRDGVILFIGGEGPGLSDDVVAACAARVTIPMQAPVESLNVAVAGALLVYEARRQRTAEPQRTA